MKNYRQKIKKLLTDETGNSMVEFALVLPLLLVLTIGSIYLSISFAQKSIMNGISFMQSRAISVRDNSQHGVTLERSLAVYRQNNQQGWLNKVNDTNVKSQSFDSNGYSHLEISNQIEAMKIDILANCLAILAGEKPSNEITKIGSGIVLPLEYAGKGTARPQTYSTVDYTTSPLISGGPLKDELLDLLPENVSKWLEKELLQSVVDAKKSDDGHNSDLADDIVSADSNKNMKNLNDMYKKWGLDKDSKSEELTKSGGFNSLRFLELTGEYIKQIELGSAITQRLLEYLTGIGLSGPLSELIAGQILESVASASHGFAALAEYNNNIMFKESFTD